MCYLSLFYPKYGNERTTIPPNAHVTFRTLNKKRIQDNGRVYSKHALFVQKNYRVSSSTRIKSLVSVFILETHNYTNYKCLSKFVQTNNASSLSNNPWKLTIFTINRLTSWLVRRLSCCGKFIYDRCQKQWEDGNSTSAHCERKLEGPTEQDAHVEPQRLVALVSI